ncbi:SAF domain-containing protein [Lentzea jiangxiensis]|uniref:Chaperone for flagella basal body P-ring formation n=1 Tax=Lentzea jiangxiensis TaxID=641025 RepID=A0A1H0MM60_9PSEU|nr:SAF domain-containing protein [Lentzea jiangxiensis]SDO81451.1 Chaperone for flagella basal body P-ring formation [Lentzea jiangxiensis]
MTLSSTAVDRIRSLVRRRPPAAWRRLLALGLVLAALVTAFWPDVGHPAVVASRDLPAGASLTAADVRVVPLAEPLPGSFTGADAVVGRALSSPARAGVPLTDFDLADAAGDQASVAVRVADQGLAGVVRTGGRVDVVSASGEVLAENAAVRETRGQVVVITLPRLHATRVAAMSLDHALAVTLR